MKLDLTKPKLSLLYKAFVEQTALARMYGLTKYPDAENWRTTDPSDHFSAALRHIFAHLAGEENDPESGVSHLGHACANLMFEMERVYGKKIPESMEVYDKDSLSAHKVYLCVVCKKKLVDWENGFDTCTDCEAKQ